MGITAAEAAILRTQILTLWGVGMEKRDIAETCNCSLATVRRYITLSSVARGSAARPKADAAGPHPILATEGRYQALAAYAAQHGLTLTAATLLWHRHRATSKAMS